MMKRSFLEILVRIKNVGIRLRVIVNMDKDVFMFILIRIVFVVIVISGGICRRSVNRNYKVGGKKFFGIF